MTKWLWVCSAALLMQGCGGRVEETAPLEEEADAAITSEADASDPGANVPVTLPNGCVLCNDDKLCNYCLVQMSEETWRCPISASPPSQECWGVGEAHISDGYLFTCFYC